MLAYMWWNMLACLVRCITAQPRLPDNKPYCSNTFNHSLHIGSCAVIVVCYQKFCEHCSLSTSGITSYHELYLRYSTNSGERESRPFLEEPETSVSILISTTVLHLDIFVMHWALLARPQESGQESSICWSLTILRRKKERTRERKKAVSYTHLTLPTILRV